MGSIDCLVCSSRQVIVGRGAERSLVKPAQGAPRRPILKRADRLYALAREDSSAYEESDEFFLKSTQRNTPIQDGSRNAAHFLGKNTDWRAFRARLVALEQEGQLRVPSMVARQGNWAHPISAIEPGCILTSRHQNMEFFNHSVVLVAAHDNVSGTLGYVLNKPSPLYVNELHVGGAMLGLLNSFGHRRVYLGGPIHLENLTCLHRYVGLHGAKQVCEGIYRGGVADAAALVKANLASPREFHLVLGGAGWAPGQLEAEIAAGCWHLLAVGEDLVLPPSVGMAEDSDQPDVNPQELWNTVMESADLA